MTDSIHPDIATQHRAAQESMRKGDLRAAHQHCLGILKLDPTFADAWFLCGVIAASNGLTAKAVDILVRAVSLAQAGGQDNPEYRAELAKLLLAQDQFGRAQVEADAALALQPTQPTVLNTLGTVMSHLGAHEQALQCYQQAIEAIETGSTRLASEWQADLYFNAGASLQFSGNAEAAEAAYEKAVALKPTKFRAHSALATLRKHTDADNHLERLHNLRDKVETAQDQLHLGHAIARELEDIQEFEKSLEYLAWAKQATANEVTYSANNDALQMATIAKTLNLETLEQHAPGYDNDEPIFIVGMPRTGTTLVEQIVGAHSQVFAAGELTNFSSQLRQLTGSTESMALEDKAIQSFGDIDPQVLGKRYVDSTRPRTGQTAHFTDKLPLNFLFLGLIHRALPKAKIICLRRDPMDTCLSNYRQLFATGFNHYLYNLDLLNCGRYYIGFDRLMHHWRELMPGIILELQYETLVADPEAQTRRLLEHCGLPFEEQCLSFQEQRSSVATPSAVQVRQGIYTSSVDRWRRYGTAMEPLYELLCEAGLYD